MLVVDTSFTTLRKLYNKKRRSFLRRQKKVKLFFIRNFTVPANAIAASTSQSKKPHGREVNPHAHPKIVGMHARLKNNDRT